MGEVKETYAQPESWYVKCPYCGWADTVLPGSDHFQEEYLNEHGNLVCPECGKKSRYKGCKI